MGCKMCTYELAILTMEKGEKNEYLQKNADVGHFQSVIELMVKFDRQYWGGVFFMNSAER